MKVIFIPDYRNVNAYQINLAESISRLNVEINFGGFYGMFAVLKSVKKFWKPDILHIHWTNPFTIGRGKIMTVIMAGDFIFELLLLKFLGIRVVWTVHNIVNHEEKFSSLELFFNKLIARLCDRLIVHCPSAKKDVMKIYNIEASSIAVISHGNYIDSYENIITSSQAKESLELDITDIVFLNFGQIRPYKGIPELITAFERLNNKKAKLLIAGKPLNDEVARDILERCKNNKRIKTFFGFIPDDEIQVYMNAADIVVLPYREISTSGAVITAMSFGKTLIAPSAGCIADILDERGCFLYRKIQGGLLKAMQRALDTDKAILQSMGKYNLGLAEHLGWNEIAEDTCNVYRKSKNS